MNKGQVNIYKPLGKTTVEMIELLKEKFPEYANQKISYAGRLDPMAHGVLVLLIGEDENKARREREKSDKDYEFTALFGIGSDTFDICGIPTLGKKEVTVEDIKQALPKFTGTIHQKIPIYSAYRVKGKPMYVLAAKGELKPQDVPTIEREVFTLDILSHKTISSSKLLKEVEERLNLITRGDFRQKEILEKYKELLKEEKEFLLVNFKSHVSSGTYVRSLCNDIGEYLGCKGISIEILRTRSGDFKLQNSIRL